MLIRFGLFGWLLGAGFLAVLLPFVWRRKRSLAALFFFSVFWVYLLAVVQVIIFPIAVSASPGSAPFSPSINLVPFYFGNCFKNIPGLCAQNLLQNILLTIPFGFGLNFLTRVKPGNVPWLAGAVGIGFELSQLAISLIFRSGFRAVDINDAILNAAGVLLGYVLFRGFARFYHQATERFGLKHKGLFADIYEVVTRPADRD
jgi:glycopeptide antibiotics resistance protein